jgi:4-diphosphocytidyl-2-C-methyl-D-erythritol kinase
MISIKAPAKINLYLHVTGRRSDGFHVLDSLIAFADVSDELAVNDGGKLSLEINGPFAGSLPTTNNNLVTKATILLAECMGIKPNVSINLTKNLPVSSGIGGGSIDAAATLQVLCKFWNYSPPKELLFQIAEKLGADVPACLFGRASFVSGIGNELTPAPTLPECWLVLVNPGIPVSTRQIFINHSGNFSQSAPFEQPLNNLSELVALLVNRSNDLTNAAIIEAPIIRNILSTFGQYPGTLLARLSGSGATCFGLFENETDAKTAAVSLAEKNPQWWVCAAPMLNKWGKIQIKIE